MERSQRIRMEKEMNENPKKLIVCIYLFSKLFTRPFFTWKMVTSFMNAPKGTCGHASPGAHWHEHRRGETSLP